MARGPPASGFDGTVPRQPHQWGKDMTDNGLSQSHHLMLSETGSSPPRLNIWQQNLNKSDKAHFNLINSPLHMKWDLLLLQEPYIDKLGNTKATSKWHTVYPSSHLTNTSITRAVILVSAAIDSNTWTQVLFEGSNDVVVIKLQLAQGQLFIFNIYNDCTHSDTLSLL